MKASKELMEFVEDLRQEAKVVASTLYLIRDVAFVDYGKLK